MGSEMCIRDSSWIYPQKDIATRKDLGPGLQGMQVVQRDLGSHLEACLVFFAWSEVGRKEYGTRLKDLETEHLQESMELAGADTLEAQTSRSETSKDVGIGVGFHGKERCVDAPQRLQSSRLLIECGGVVDIDRGLAARDLEQGGSGRTPPWWGERFSLDLDVGLE